MRMIKVDHVAVVVDDMSSALDFWQHALGLPLAGKESNADEAVEVAFLPVGQSRIELLQPTSEDSGIAKFLIKRGTGMHHICLAVTDLDEYVLRLTHNNIELINEQPRTREDGTRYVFIHPRSTGGVLVELYEYHGKED